MTAPTFHQYLQAGYPCLWVNSFEEQRAMKSLSEQAEDYKVFSWDIMAGMRNHETGTAQPLPDPVKALEAINTMPEGSIFFYKDAHKFLQNINVIRTVKNMIPVLKSSDRHLIFISPVTQIPIELEKDVTTFPFNLPTIGELMAVAQKIVEDNALDKEVDEATISAAQGMTLDESENAMALSLITEKTFSRKILEAEKLQAVKKSGLMELYSAVEESELGGLENLKKYIHNRKQGFYDPSLPTPKGLLLIGLPGCGKSLSAKAIASVLDAQLIRLDIGSLKDKHVGGTEQKTRQMWSLLKAVASPKSPVILWIDEIEKAFGGVQSSNHTDGGTTSSMFGTFLTEMQEAAGQGIYIVGTCNEIEDLLAISQGALLRRFDSVFLIDLPSEDERRQILKIMNRRYNADIPDSWVPQMTNWTGAEIERFVVDSFYDDEAEAFANVKPIYEQNRDRIDKMREWGKTNARWANTQPTTKTNMRRVRA